MKKPKIIVVGAGLSGLMATLRLAEKGLTVLHFSLLPSECSDTGTMHGGIGAAINQKEIHDSPETHFADTIIGGDFLANQHLPQKMCSWAPKLIHLLERMGVPFNQTEEGFYDFRPSEGVRSYRTLFSGTHTGKKILQVFNSHLRRFVHDGLVVPLSGWEFLSLVKNSRGVSCGFVAINRWSLELKSFAADAIIFCTGGVGGLFQNSTQSCMSTGSAASILYQQGASYANGEFIQFEPASIPGFDKCHGVTAPLLSEGGRFWVPQKERPWYFMEDLYPTYKNWVPYDLASQTIHHVVHDKNLGVGGKSLVYLDLTHRPEKVIKTKLKGIYDLALKLVQVDITKSPLPVFPAVSYSLGGLFVDNNHATTIPGVFAAGECQYQYHGANVLKSNIFLSSLFGGMVAANQAIYYASGLEMSSESVKDTIFNEALKIEHEKNRGILDGTGHDAPRLLYQELTSWMSENVGVVRENNKLVQTEEKVTELKKRFSKMVLSDRGSWVNEELLFSRNLWNMLELAHVIVKGAFLRNELRGCHYKKEFPKRDDLQFLKTTKALWTPDGPKIEFEDVRAKFLAPGKRIY